jgi:hypothetical protein
MRAVAWAIKVADFRWGANAMYTHLSNALNPSDLLYNEFRFAGSNALNLSIDYKLLWRNINFFGETAMSGNGAIASVNGAIVSLDKRVFLSVAHRQYSHRYQPSPFTAAFAENSQPVNENGLFLGLLIKPAKGWEITAYADLYRSNWLRFKTDGLGYGHDYLAQVTWKPVREMEMYARFRYENKQQNAPNNSSPTDYLDDNERSGFPLPNRLQIDQSRALAQPCRMVVVRRRNRRPQSCPQSRTGFYGHAGFDTQTPIVALFDGSPFRFIRYRLV